MCDCAPNPLAQTNTRPPNINILHIVEYPTCETSTQTIEEYKILLFLRRNQIDKAKAMARLKQIQKLKAHALRSGILSSFNQH